MNEQHPVTTIAEEDGIKIEGWCDPAFCDVGEAFASNLMSRTEDGASLCVYHQDRIVADLWGGCADPANGLPWTRETVSLIFSATKAATAICIHLLEQRGKLSLEQPVAEIWPEFAQNGKHTITLRMVLDHTAGLPIITSPLKADCLVDHTFMADAIAAAAPLWPPGTRSAYHPLTGGFILAEIVKLVDGRTLGRYFAEEIAEPVGLDFWIGLPAEIEPRVAPMIPHRPAKNRKSTPFAEAARTAGSLQNLWFFNHGDWQTGGMNTRAGRAAEIGAANGITNAAGLAGLYHALRPNGPLGLDQERLLGFSEASSATHRDGMFLQPMRYGPGFMLRMDNRASNRGDSMIIGRGAFGHVGAGGSIGFRDPELGIAFGYTMNRMGPGFLLNERGQGLVDAAYGCATRGT